MVLIDERYLFIHTTISKIFGLERHDHQNKQSDTEDTFGWELRHFLNLLRNGNTMCLEMLYNDTWIEITSEYSYIQSFKDKLVDSHKLFKCLKGYCFSEKRLTLGERTGRLGGKRCETLKQYGYSYKNAVQFLRLCLCGKIFFQEGYFPVNISKFDEHKLMFDIKTNPGNYNKEKIIELMDLYENDLNASYDNIKIIYKYNNSIADKLCYELYMPILNKL